MAELIPIIIAGGFFFIGLAIYFTVTRQDNADDVNTTPWGDTTGYDDTPPWRR